MLLWALLLVFGLVRRQVAIAKKAVVLLDPPWTTVFRGEKVTLTCHGVSTFQLRTEWWLSNHRLEVNWASFEPQWDGVYSCKDKDTSRSDPVNLVFSSDYLILQAPYSVFEGDTLVLRCRERRDVTVEEKIYYKDGKELLSLHENFFLSIPQVGLTHSGQYHCKAHRFYGFSPINSKRVKVQVQELFPPPELKTTTSQPIEGTSLTLSCETQLPPQRSDMELCFSFSRDGRDISSGCMKSQEFQIPTIRREDSGSYQCTAKVVTRNIMKHSNNPMKIDVKKIPVSGVFMTTLPPGGQVTEGEKLVLICSMAQGTGNITFSWHRNDSETSLGVKTQHSMKEEFVLSAVNETDAGKYYCTADNGFNINYSPTVKVTVKIPVSQLLFNLSALGEQVTVGDVVEFQCKALRGSLPIQYQFYHDGVILENQITLSGAAASFNLSMTMGHSGNYFCEANNSFSRQLSESLTLSISGSIRSQKNMVIWGVTVALISILILTSVALVIFFRLLRKSGKEGRKKIFVSGGSSTPSPYRASPIVSFQEPIYSNQSAQMELVSIYGNVNPTDVDIIYSEVQNTQQGNKSRVNPIDENIIYPEVHSIQYGKKADNTRTPPEDLNSSVIYAEIKKPNHYRFQEQARAENRSHEDIAESY